MGNSSSTSSGRGPQDETVDFGSLTPQGVYTGPKDWNQPVVSQLICARRLAPFYRPLEEYDESWDDEKILAARKELPVDPETNLESRVEATNSPTPPKSGSSKRPSLAKDNAKSEAALYRGAVECPICFLYFPPNINHSRCCDQAICTECFVQIKRAEPTTTHLVSEPAACPYCVQDNFGVVYTPPPWRAGIGADSSSYAWPDSPKGSQQTIDTSTPYPTHKRRQKSFGHTSPEVVTTDQIRPDWEAKLAAVRAAVTRRANRRIIMRQVGDQLIPVGVTSGRVLPVSTEEAAQAEQPAENGSRRSRRRQQQQQQQPQQGFDQFLGTMGMGGQELEDLMMMEAMRLSLLDHEEHQRKEAEEKKKNKGKETTEETVASSSTGHAGPGPATLDARAVNINNSSRTSLSPSAASPTSVTDESTGRRSSIEGPRHSRSPSQVRPSTPPPANPIAALQSLGDSQPQRQTTSSGWRRSKPTHSTLAAALSAASTVGAVLGSGQTTSTAGQQGAVQVEPTGSSSIQDDLFAASTSSFLDSPRDDGHPSSLSTPPAVPMSQKDITPDRGASTVPEEELTTSSHATPVIASIHIGQTESASDESHPPSSRPDFEPSTSFASSIISLSSDADADPYDNLPSSPDSVVSHQPLLGSDTPAATTKHDIITPATSPQDDYFGNTDGRA